MRRLILAAASLLAGCAPQMAMTEATDWTPEWKRDRPVPASEPRIVPIPPIPAALHGCWDAIPPSDPEEPGGPHRLVVDATTLTISGYGSGSEVATAEYVKRVTPTSIEGLFSSQDQHGRSTVATALSIDDSGTLTRDEGDAGDSIYRRCGIQP